MALFSFTRAILEGRPIDVYGNGLLKRDFTHVSDIVEGIMRVCQSPAVGSSDWDGDLASSVAPYRIYNIGSHCPVEVSRFIDLIEEHTGKKAIRNLLPAQPGDLVDTFADVSDIHRDLGFEPKMPIEEGIGTFVAWYRSYYTV
jgi:UDP-glucuronate 4-epimerase